MKGRIFIGWSGDTRIAEEVKAKLKKANYEGIVGGETGAAKTLFLGQAILEEIDTCDQGIFVFQKKKDGHISPSTLFELGYALARLKANKIHIFYVDIPEKDESIPTDLEGSWATHLFNVEEGMIDDKVIEIFLANQKKVFVGNKMEIINDYYEFRRDFDNYVKTSFCSEYELAQYVLFFSQAAYMFNDVYEGQACLTKLANSLTHISPELGTALRFAWGYLDIFVHVRAQEDILYLETIHFSDARETFSGVLKNLKSWPENEFKTWLELLALESLNYIHILGAACPDIPLDRRNRMLKNSIPYANRSLEKCEALTGSPNNELNDLSNNEQCVTLYRAYMFRNLSTAYLKLGETDKSKEYLKQSYEERRKLLEYYKVKTISSRIFESIEMEYYLAISELLDYHEDVDTLAESIDSCNDYLDKIKKLHLEKSHFINRIEHNLRLAEGRL